MNETTSPYRYLDGDSFCLSARLLPDLNTGGVTDTLSITIEGSDEPQSVHVPAGDVPALAAGIVAAAGQQPAATVPASAPTDDDLIRVLHELHLRRDFEAAEFVAEVRAVLPAPAACSDPIECSHEAALGETRARVERLALAFEVAGNEFIAERIREALGGDAASGPGRADDKTQQDEPEALPLLFWDEPAGVVHEDGRITAWLSKAVSLAQSVPAGQLILQPDAAARLRRALTTALNEADDAREAAERAAANCRDAEGCHRVVPCVPGCAARWQHAAVSQPGKEA